MTPEQLRTIRTKKAKMTQEQFARAMRVAVTTVRHWEYASSFTQRQVDNLIPRLIAAGLWEGEE